MKTYRITEKDIEGMTPVAVGYKIFNHDYPEYNAEIFEKIIGDIEE